ADENSPGSSLGIPETDQRLTLGLGPRGHSGSRTLDRCCATAQRAGGARPRVKPWVGVGRHPSLARVGQDEVMEAVLLVPGNLAGCVEETQEQLAEVIGPHAVEVMFPLAARLDQARDAEQSQVVAHGRLALTQAMTEVGDMQLAVGREGQIEQDAQAR